ncbi:MAG TPA: DoxX family protein [Candidatus Babeliales bacterium]|nr:DoxX family protein [Candidatus Babeliales bacterium]
MQLSRYLPMRPAQPQLGMFIVRLVVGSTFVLHGGQKVFGWFGGPGLDGYIDYVTSMGAAPFWGYLSAFGEFFGGLMVLIGIAAELGALIIALDMLWAIFMVHWPHGYFIQDHGFEYPLNLLLLCLALIFGGCGKYYYLCKRCG